MEQVDLLVIAGICAWAVERMRRSSWFPWVNEHTHRYVAALVAAGAAIGVHVTFDQAAGQLTITGLHLAQVPHALQELVRTWALQHGADHVLHAQQRTYQPEPVATVTES
jgi:hypothetical protein